VLNGWTPGTGLGTRAPRAAIAVVVAVLLGLTAGLAGCAAPSIDAPARGTQTSAASAGHSGLPVVAVADLPAEARRTLALIDSGGAFPYARDGAVFANRERLLPQRARGYYREYTVPTPGEQDRGARRVIAGAGGERFYTGDHYRSFREVRR
jgi:ribonuclease T1